MNIIDGKAIALAVEIETRTRIALLNARGITPGLAMVLIGQDPASQAYVRNKDRACVSLGIHSRKFELPTSTTQNEIMNLVAQLNADQFIHGILIQSPPPKHIDEHAITLAIDPRKDVDGFHPINVAKLAMEDPSAFIPCTPLACQKILIASDIDTTGAEIVVIGRSHIVGKPMALMLMSQGKGGNATVTIAHSRTKNLATITRRADILIVAIGSPQKLCSEHIKKGAVVIDVGINRIKDPTTKSGYRIVGDVNFDDVASHCKAITPVPGGVGPMTIAMLMSNTVTAAERLSALSQ